MINTQKEDDVITYEELSSLLNELVRQIPPELSYLITISHNTSSVLRTNHSSSTSAIEELQEIIEALRT